MPASTPGPAVGVVGVWTSADLPGVGDQLLARVIEAELLARLPGWRAALFAPRGWDRPFPGDGAVLAEPLGTYSPTRIAQLASGATATVLCPGFPLGADLRADYGDDAAAPFFAAGPQEGHPVVLAGVRVAGEVPPELAVLAGRALAVLVRDKRSRDLLRDVGVEAEVVPHPGLLLGRAVDLDTLPARAEQLRRLGLTENDELCLEDRLALLATAEHVVAIDEHVAAAAAGLGVPWVLVDPDGSNRAAVEEFADPRRIVDSVDDVAEARRATENLPSRKEDAPAAVAAALDRVAELAGQVLGGEPQVRLSALTAENLALRTANHRQRDRVRVERQRLTDAYASALLERNDAVAELARIRSEHEELAARHAQLAGRLADCERELNAWRGTKLVRWSKPLRQAYGRARGR